jgi:hypothetical protein
VVIQLIVMASAIWIRQIDEEFLPVSLPDGR